VGTARTLRPKRLGEKLAAIRRRFNLSQNELIRRLGFADVLLREEISSFERDIRVPPPLVLLEYARLARVHVEVLIDDSMDLPARIPADPSKHSPRSAKSAKKKGSDY
jgi:transcriptional regulator with XRE-family HTH domain